MVRGKKNPAHVGFPARLRKARKAADVTRHKLSLSAGIASDGVNDLETGGRIPGIDTVERLALALNVSPCWLAFGKDQTGPVVEGLRCASLGQRVTEARLRAGLSGRALAAAAELSAPTVLRAEKALFFPRLDSVEKLATALRVTSCWLAFGLGPMQAPRRRHAERPSTAAQQGADGSRG